MIIVVNFVFDWDYLENGTGASRDTGPLVSALTSNGAGDTGTLGLTLRVDNDTGVILEHDEVTIGALPGLALTDNDSGHDLLAKFGLTLLDGSDDHVTDSGRGETVLDTVVTLDGDDEKVLGTGVISAVDDSVGRKTGSDTELTTALTTTTLEGRLRHCRLFFQLLEQTIYNVEAYLQGSWWSVRW
jgi:hypothetical protein